MHKLRLKETGCLCALAAAFVVLLCALYTSSSARAGIVPLPERKPPVKSIQKISVETEADADGSEASRPSIKDLAIALLDFNDEEIPLPKPKPFQADDGKPLSSSDIERYKTIFALQDEGKMKEADKEIERLSNTRLRGYVLYQRYMHPTAYKSSFTELRNWLTLYADLPGANRIYALAMSKKPKDFEGSIKRPVYMRGIARRADPAIYEGRRYQSAALRDTEGKASVAAFRKEVLAEVKAGEPEDAIELMSDDARAKLLDETEQDILKARIAAGYLYEGKTAKAQKIAAAASRRSGDAVPLAGWIAGLTLWQDGRYSEAAGYFEHTARSPYSSGWYASAGSYWAARSHMRAGNVVAVSKWLKKATEHPRTFYGLIATRALGRDFEFNWDLPGFTEEYDQILRQTPAGQRALDLMETDQIGFAEAELLRINPGRDKEARKAFLAYAGHAGMPALALRMGSYGEELEGQSQDAALYPVSPWQPAEGYKVDPALIQAIIRQESRFDPRAESPSGAQGLMQLMPRTARAMAGKRNPVLTDPATNIEIGQKYIKHLFNSRSVDGDVLSMLIAYNAGPGNLQRWRKRWRHVEDPLLFIELIPLAETRGYVEKVLSNYWIYRLRDNQPTPTLNAVVEGRKAAYAYKAEEKSFQLANK